MDEPFFEREAELAYQHLAELEQAAAWCCRTFPHNLQFLNNMRQLLVAEDHQLIKLGLGNAMRLGVVRRSSVLALLTPSQALRLLECYTRASHNDQAIWRAKNLKEMAAVTAERQANTALERLREHWRQQESN